MKVKNPGLVKLLRVFAQVWYSEDEAAIDLVVKVALQFPEFYNHVNYYKQRSEREG